MDMYRQGDIKVKRTRRVAAQPRVERKRKRENVGGER
jgi:hypothetical protein